MSRPTRFCGSCGEYVDEREDSWWSDKTRTWHRVVRLVHVDGAGARVYRSHAAIDEGDETY